MLFMRCFLIASFVYLFFLGKSSAQSPPEENTERNIKIEHADPVFEDLTTDLGARTGENELNANFGYRKLRKNHHVFLSQLEYEIAPVDHLGLEILLPYTVYFNNQLDEKERPENRMEFFQWSTQYTFYTSTKRKVSMAVNFRNILETQDPHQNKRDFNLQTVTYNPFLIFAKNWQDRYFLLFSGGLEILHEVEERQFELSYPINTAFHYKFSEQDHFVGIEFNKNVEDKAFEMFIRPQVILQILEEINLGAAFGIPIGMSDDQWMAFLRLAYEFD